MHTKPYTGCGLIRLRGWTLPSHPIDERAGDPSWNGLNDRRTFPLSMLFTAH